jgi:hypothetical protein
MIGKYALKGRLGELFRVHSAECRTRAGAKMVGA